MWTLNWLLGEAVESPGVALNRDSEVSDPASFDYGCTDYRDYLKKRRELIDVAEKRLEEKYQNAREDAKAVIERYAKKLEYREKVLEQAKAEFVENRDLILAALRDAKQTALAKHLSDKMELWK